MMRNAMRVLVVVLTPYLMGSIDFSLNISGGFVTGSHSATPGIGQSTVSDLEGDISFGAPAINACSTAGPSSTSLSCSTALPFTCPEGATEALMYASTRADNGAQHQINTSYHDCPGGGRGDPTPE